MTALFSVFICKLFSVCKLLTYNSTRIMYFRGTLSSFFVFRMNLSIGDAKFLFQSSFLIITMTVSVHGIIYN